MKQMLIYLLFAALLVASPNQHQTGRSAKSLDATANPAPKVKSYAVGGKLIAIPSPSTDLVAARSKRELRLMHIFSNANNRIVAGFFPSKGLSALQKGGQRDRRTVDYAIVEVSRGSEYRNFGARSFKRMEQNLKTQLGSIISSGRTSSANDLERRLRTLNIKNAKISFGKPVVLGIIFSKPDEIGYGMVVANSVYGNKYKMGDISVLMRVKNRMLFAYLYRVYDNANTMKWLAVTSENWAEAILKANKDHRS